MIKACLFDLDGVVLDTEPLYTLFWHDMGNKYRPDVPDFEYVIKGQTLVQIYDKYFAGEETMQKEITELLNEYEHNMSYDYIVGFEHFVKELRNKGLKTAVVTSSKDILMRFSPQKTLLRVNLHLIVISRQQPVLESYQRSASFLRTVSMDYAPALPLVHVL